MKLINKFKSPNFDKRTCNKIKFIIIHYTALSNCSEAINYLCDKRNKVSSHYLISQKGEIYNLVDIKKRAWHAGYSYWGKDTDINSMSIGIELDFSDAYKNDVFRKKMIFSLKLLIKHLLKKYKIKPINVLGHSDIAPYRKKDPGKKFPWKDLYLNNLSYYPKYEINIKNNLIKKWFYKFNLKNKKQISLFILGFVGYDTLKSKNSAYYFKILIHKYQTHYLQRNITGKVDGITFNFLVKHYINLVLTIK